MAPCPLVGSPAQSAQVVGCPESRPDPTRRLPARTPDNTTARARAQRAHRPTPGSDGAPRSWPPLTAAGSDLVPRWRGGSTALSVPDALPMSADHAEAAYAVAPRAAAASAPPGSTTAEAKSSRHRAKLATSAPG